MEGSLQKARCAWVDVFKFFAILSVFIAHLGPGGSKAYLFIFQFPVELFFLSSGFFAPGGVQGKFLPYLNKKFCSIMLPYFGFSALNILMISLQRDCSLFDLKKMLIYTAMGVRTRTVAAALWFLPALFSASLIYYGLKRLLRRDVFVAFTAFVIFVLAEMGIPYRPVGDPKLFWGIDSALYYLFYFALGAAAFPCIRELRLSGLKRKHWLILGAASLLCGFIVVVALFSGVVHPLRYLPLPMQTPCRTFYPACLSMSVAFFLVLLSKWLEKADFLAAIGRDTLILCGTEEIIKGSVAALSSVFGLTVQSPTMFATAVYIALLLVLAHFTVVKWIKKYFPILAGAWRFPPQFLSVRGGQRAGQDIHG